MTGYPTEIGFAELQDKHLEFRRVLTCVPLGALANGLDALDGIDIAVGGLIPFLEGEESLDTLVKKACNIARNVEFGKSLEQPMQQLRNFVPRPAVGNTSSGSIKPTGRPKFTTKLTDSDRTTLRNNNGCFNCRKINVDHISTDCPDKGNFNWKPVEKAEAKKESVSMLDAVVEFDSD